MKKVTLTFACIFVLLCLCPTCTVKHSHLAPFPTPTITTTLSSEDVTAFAMDKNGYMWIGTSNGLNLFDGKYYRQFFFIPDDSTSLIDNQIKFLFKDSQDRIWIGTPNGICRYLGANRFKAIPIPPKYPHVFQIIENCSKEIFFVTDKAVLQYNESLNTCTEALTYSPSHENNIKFFSDRNGYFWKITLSAIHCYTKDFNEVFSVPNSAALNVVNAIMDDNCIWSTGGNGLLRYDIKNKRITTIRDSAFFNQVNIVPRNIIAYNHKIWLVAKDNIYSYNENTDKFICENEITDILIGHYSPFISTLYVDTENNLWIGFSNGGYTNFKQLSNKAALHHHPFIERLKNTSIRALSANKNILWGISGNNDIFSYNISSKKLVLFKGSTDIEGIATRRFQHKINNISCFSNNVWLLSNSRLMCYNYIDERLKLKKVFRLGMHNISIGNSCTDTEGNLYVTTNINSLFKVSANGERIDTIKINLPPYSINSCIQHLSSNQILICTQGLKFAYYKADKRCIYPLDITTPNHTKGIIPTCILEDKQKNIWIGTNKGLYQLNIQTKKLIHRHSVPDIYISSIVEDSKQRLWMGTHQGIAEYISQYDKIRFYPNTTNSQDKYGVFNQNSACVLQDTIFFFGHAKGCSVFTPAILEQTSLPTVHIENILITKANKVFGIDCLNKPIEKIHLKYYENDLTINFSTVSFAIGSQFSCFYKMEGFDPDWIRCNENRQAIYSNLPAGNYTFKVKITPVGETETFSEQRFLLSVDKAPWVSIPAIIFYIILLVGISLQINHLYLNIKSNRIAMQMLQRDKEREHVTNQMNMNFFANISHEFRNPLTMILGPIITLKNDKNLSTQSHQMLQIVSRSINQMLRLIDQMLDFNKLENDALRMQIGKYDIANEITNWAETLRIGAVQKNINVECVGLENSFFTWADKDKLAKILSNLFTNALKHTSQNGNIKIGMECIPRDEALSITAQLPVISDKYVHIYVQDSGIGIPDEQLNDIFKRYYQADNKSGLKYATWGTGIGLYYVRRLVQLHHGEVVAENAKRPAHGAIFHVLLPADEEAYMEDEKISINDDRQDTTTDLNISISPVATINPSRPYVLIVDDDTQVASYLKTLLYEEYNIINKYSAESALTALETIEPDIILSDVVMGEMSGYDFCKKLKESRLYCHIPIILLTAKTKIGEQVEGLTTGASAYVTKPFNPNYLKALIKSLLRNRDDIRTLLSSSSATTQNITNSLSPQDAEFMKDLYELMEDMITQPDLDFNTIAKKLCMSRSKFNYKLKGLTGETPVHFFLKYKLNKAAELLRSGKYNVSEVADITGFGTISHFSVSFKKYFGVNPSEYK